MLLQSFQKQNRILKLFGSHNVQCREKRVAPGLVITEYQVEPLTEVRDLLATAAFDTQKSWSWIKEYRRTMLGGGRYASFSLSLGSPGLQPRFRYIAQLPEFLKSEEWSNMAHDVSVKQRIEELVNYAYHPKPKPKVLKTEKTAEQKAKNKQQNKAKPKKAKKDDKPKK